MFGLVATGHPGHQPQCQHILQGWAHTPSNSQGMGREIPLSGLSTAAEGDGLCEECLAPGGTPVLLYFIKCQGRQVDCSH